MDKLTGKQETKNGPKYFPPWPVVVRISIRSDRECRLPGSQICKEF